MNKAPFLLYTAILTVRKLEVTIEGDLTLLCLGGAREVGRNFILCGVIQQNVLNK